MPISDFFRFQDPLVRSGLISRGDNWEMRLGSLAAALGGMERQGQLGQALAQAGAIYQQQRQGVLASAFERAKEEAKQRREDELLRMRYEEYGAGVAERNRLAAERDAEVEKEIQGREAARRWLVEHDYPAQYADNKDLLDWAQGDYAAKQKPAEEEKAPPLHNLGGGVSVMWNPATKKYEKQDFGYIPSGGGGNEPDAAQVEALVRQYPQHEAIIRLNPQSFATQAAQNAFDRPAGTGRAGADPADELMKSADELMESDWADEWGEAHGVPPSYEDAAAEVQRRKQVVESILGPRPSRIMPGVQSGSSTSVPLSKKVLDSRAQDLRGGIHKVKPAGGEVIAGMTMPTPGKSSFGTGKTEMLKAQPARTPEAARSMVILDAVAERYKAGLPPQAQQQVDLIIKQRIAAGEDPETIAREIEAKLSLLMARQ